MAGPKRASVGGTPRGTAAERERARVAISSSSRPGRLWIKSLPHILSTALFSLHEYWITAGAGRTGTGSPLHSPHSWACGVGPASPTTASRNRSPLPLLGTLQSLRPLYVIYHYHSTQKKRKRGAQKAVKEGHSSLPLSTLLSTADSNETLRLMKF